MAKIARYWHTVRHLRPVQIFGRALFRLSRPRPDLRPAPPRRAQPVDLASIAWRQPSMLSPTTFCFLNKEGHIADRDDWNSPSHDRLWLYNLHYFDDLTAADAEVRRSWHDALVKRWVAENPPGEGVGWAPYPVSLRMVNWIKWLLGGNVPDPAMLDSLAVQARWLRRRLEVHLLGNHLLANAKALVFVGLFFSGEEAEGWYRHGMRLLNREFGEQVLADGGHFELSPMYHLIVLEDLLDLIALHLVFKRPVPTPCQELAKPMFSWARTMTHSDGKLAFFNDAAFDVAPGLNKLEDHARRLGLDPGATTPGPAMHLRDSGYGRLSIGGATVLIDMAAVGPGYLPAHAHADTLSFEFSLGTRRVIVNGGTSEYGAGVERSRQRSTAAHSTLMIDGQDSSEVWGGFRVARRARTFDAKVGQEDERVFARASHDGYRRLPGSPIHTRTWSLGPATLRLQDQVTGLGRHVLHILLPLGPGLVAEPADDRSMNVRDEDTGMAVAMVRFGAKGAPFVEPATWHPRFGVAIPTQRIGLRVDQDLPFETETIIEWDQA